MYNYGFPVTIKIPGRFEGITFFFDSRKQALKLKFKIPNLLLSEEVLYKGCLFGRHRLIKDGDIKFAELSSELKEFLGYLTTNRKKAWLMSNQGVDDILNPLALEAYNKIGYPNNVFMLEAALIAKLEVDPDFEMWVPLKYHRGLGNSKDTTPLFLQSDDLLISNQGRVVILKQNFEVSHGRLKQGYLRTAFREGDDTFSFAVHRAVGCCYLDAVMRFPGSRITGLEINHLDGIKIHNYVLNLEWGSSSHNKTHSIKSGLKNYLSGVNNTVVKVLLGEVRIPGEYEGFKFIIAGEKDCIKFGLRNASRVAAGKVGIHKGCVFTHATKEDLVNFEYINKLPEPLLKLIQDFKSNSK